MDEFFVIVLPVPPGAFLIGSIVSAMKGDWIAASIFGWLVIAVFLLVFLLWIAYDVGRKSR